MDIPKIIRGLGGASSLGLYPTHTVACSNTRTFNRALVTAGESVSKEPRKKGKKKKKNKQDNRKGKEKKRAGKGKREWKPDKSGKCGKIVRARAAGSGGGVVFLFLWRR
jgi:hypothetical protein